MGPEIVSQLLLSEPRLSFDMPSLLLHSKSRWDVPATRLSLNGILIFDYRPQDYPFSHAEHVDHISPVAGTFLRKYQLVLAPKTPNAINSVFLLHTAGFGEALYYSMENWITKYRLLGKSTGGRVPPCDEWVYTELVPVMLHQLNRLTEELDGLVWFAGRVRYLEAQPASGIQNLDELRRAWLEETLEMISRQCWTDPRFTRALGLKPFT
jgi:hypothetical protein